MKNIVLFILLLVSFGTYGQTPQYLGNKNTNIIITGLFTSDSMMNMHLYDTATTKLAFPVKLQHRIARQNGRLYQHNGSKFVLFDSVISSGGSTIDTTSLSNRIDQRVKYTDTASMLAPYATKQNLKDTASALRALISSISGADSTIFATQYRLDTVKANRVPYVGATTNVNLGEWQASVGQITLDQTPTQSAGVGVLRWNDNDGTADLGMKGGNVTLQIGQEQLVRVVNKTGSNLLENEYHAVYVSGAQGQRLKVANAIATSDSTSAATIGIVTENINVNQEGFVTTSGLVNAINTTGSLQGETWNDGDLLFLSGTTAGAITNVKPSAPIHTIILGYVVYAHATQGKIYVKVDNGYELDELHNVAISSVANNDGLFYESSTSLWKNKSIATVLGYTPANNASVVKYTDTASMLSNYAKSNLVVKYNDTSTMLLPYLRKVDTATLSARINNTWSLLGNSGTTAGTNFIGTTDAQDLVFKRNSNIAGRIGTSNTSLGDSTLKSVTSGTGNTAFGFGSLKTITTTSNNTSFGYNALSSTTGGNNTTFGYSAGAGITSGSNNIAIGYNAIAGTTGSKNLTISYSGTIPTFASSNQLNIGNVLWGTGCSGTSSTAAGSLSIGANAPNASAILDITSTTQGLAIPSMTGTQMNAIATPKTGLIVFNTTDSRIYSYSGSAWGAVVNNGTDSISAKQFYSPLQTLTDGATTTWNARLGQQAIWTIGGTGRTLTISNPIAGTFYTLKLIQGTGGSKTITTYPTNTKWPGGTAPTLTTTAGAVDIICFWYDGTNYNANYMLDVK